MMKILKMTKKKVILKSKGSNSAYFKNDNLFDISTLQVPKGSVYASVIDIVSKSKKLQHF